MGLTNLQALARTAGVALPDLDSSADRAQVVEIGAPKALSDVLMPKAAEAEVRPEVKHTPQRKIAQDIRLSDFVIPSSEPRDGAVRIPEFDVKVAAGGGSLSDGADITDHWEVPRRFVSQMKASANSLNIVEVIGDSMEPKLLPGDKIIIDQNDTNPSPPGIFALWDGYGLVVKHVQWIHGTNKVLLVSENSTMYKDYEAVIDEIKIFGRIKSCIRAM
jgi:phage repressor protein C with HTH and peptisase S24 domain